MIVCDLIGVVFKCFASVIFRLTPFLVFKEIFGVTKKKL